MDRSIYTTHYLNHYGYALMFNSHVYKYIYHYDLFDKWKDEQYNDVDYYDLA